jgi:hypothetical protein
MQQYYPEYREPAIGIAPNSMVSVKGLGSIHFKKKLNKYMNAFYYL